MTVTIESKPHQPSEPSKVSEFVLNILHRAMDPGGGLIRVPLRAAVIEWVLPDDEGGEQMTYLEVVGVTEADTGKPFDAHLITDPEIHEALVSGENALPDSDSGQAALERSSIESAPTTHARLGRP